MRVSAVAVFAFLVALLAPIASSAQIVPPGAVPPGMPPGSPPQGAQTTNPGVYGLPITCSTGADRGSLPVVWLFDYNSGDAGIAAPPQIVMMGFTPQVVAPPIIRINPFILGQFPPDLQLFITAHECAHEYLPAPIASNENNADCWGAQEGVKQGFFGLADYPALSASFQHNPGNWTHMPGPQRAQHILNCMNGNVPDAYGADMTPFLF